MKSRATLSEASDHNAIYFCNCANHRRNINTIWEMSNSQGTKVRRFKELAELGVQYFNWIFEGPIRANIGEILKVVAFFPSFVNEEDNERVFRVVPKEELYHVLTNFKKKRSLGLYGWTIEFYLDFFELLGDIF